MHNPNGWSDEEIATLDRLWKEGLSCSQIARQLPGRTRNAVIGRLHRTGRAQNRAPRAMVYRLPKVNKRTSRATQNLKELLTLSLPPLEPRRQIDTIGINECRFIIGDPRAPDWAFCAHPVTSERPYCRFHHALVYQATPAKQARAA